METPYLIVGLGNPGAEYVDTRHNAGFQAVEKLAVRWGAGWQSVSRHQVRLAKGEWRQRRFLLCEPQTFMNASGEAVRSVLDFYRATVAQTLILVDDADLPLGEVRLRASGSPGGHHGLESVEKHLGTRDYARLRIGIGRTVSGVREITGHVLGRFRGEEKLLVGKVMDRACSQVECWLVEGSQAAMNKFNGSVIDPKTSTETQ